jgi:hypothetical protein
LGSRRREELEHRLVKALALRDVASMASKHSSTVMSLVAVTAWRAAGERSSSFAAATISPTVREVTGHPPRDINAFAQDYAPAFGGRIPLAAVIATYLLCR